MNTTSVEEASSILAGRTMMCETEVVAEMHKALSQAEEVSGEPNAPDTVAAKARVSQLLRVLEVEDVDEFKEEYVDGWRCLKCDGGDVEKHYLRCRKRYK